MMRATAALQSHAMNCWKNQRYTKRLEHVLPHASQQYNTGQVCNTGSKEVDKTSAAEVLQEFRESHGPEQILAGSLDFHKLMAKNWNRGLEVPFGYRTSRLSRNRIVPK